MIVELVVQFFEMGKPAPAPWGEGSFVWVCLPDEHQDVMRELHHERYREGYVWPLVCPQAQWGDRGNDSAMARCLRFGRAAYLASGEREWQQQPKRMHWTAKLTCRTKEELVG